MVDLRDAIGREDEQRPIGELAGWREDPLGCFLGSVGPRGAVPRFGPLHHPTAGAAFHEIPRHGVSPLLLILPVPDLVDDFVVKDCDPSGSFRLLCRARVDAGFGAGCA